MAHNPYPMPKETLEKALWTRLKTAADFEGETLEEFAKRSDLELRRLNNIGWKSIALLRTRYPHNWKPKSLGPGEKRDMIEFLEGIVAQCQVRIMRLKAEPPNE